MKGQRKMLFIAVFINFLIGIIIGTVLFYGQMRSIPLDGESIYLFDSNITFADFFRATWMNLIWLLSSLIAQCILPGRFVYPVMAIRGCVCSFSVLHILTFIGMKETVVSVIPQCLTSLPLLSLFSVEYVIRQRGNLNKGIEPCRIKRSEAAAMLVLSMLAGGAEVAFFRFICSILF